MLFVDTLWPDFDGDALRAALADYARPRAALRRPMSDAEDPIPPSDLPIRFAMGVLMIAVALAATLLGGWAFRLLVAAAAALMLVEWADMHGVARRWAYASAALTVAALLGAVEYLYPVAQQVDEIPEELTGLLFEPLWLGFAALLAPAALAIALSRRVVMGWGVLYIGLPAFALLSLSWVWETLVLWVFIVTWATDIFAYFAGRAIGGPKLAPRISPNKTWAGLIGGMAGGRLVRLAARLLVRDGALLPLVGRGDGPGRAGRRPLRKLGEAPRRGQGQRLAAARPWRRARPARRPARGRPGDHAAADGGVVGRVR